MNKTRCKFKLNKISEHANWSAKTMEFSAVYGDIGEDKSFAKATPNGELKITVDNLEALKLFVLGKTYYLDIIPVEE